MHLSCQLVGNDPTAHLAVLETANTEGSRVKLPELVVLVLLL